MWPKLEVRAGTAEFGRLNGLIRGPSASAGAANSVLGARSQAALARLAQNPRDVGALVDAGTASLAMNDLDAATGFFRRAQQIAPSNSGAAAGLAAAWARSGKPREALEAFQRLDPLAPLDPMVLADKGLAYDLIGDNGSAQVAYRAAIAAPGNDVVVTRLAISLAIAGVKDEPDNLLSASIARGDPASVRSRAIVLAIQGRVDEAVAIANAALPPALAAGISPYLRYFPRLTRSQQAAAANLGMFPRASEIGRDTSLPTSFGTEPQRAGSSGTADIAAPLRAAAAARAASQNVAQASDEEFRALFASWAALER